MPSVPPVPGLPTPDSTLAAPYVAPAVVVLGTLAELTLGGSDALPDGFGGAGDSGDTTSGSW
jgi:hypothetical protein